MTTSDTCQEFDPSDPFDFASDDFRRQVMLMAAEAFEAPPFRDLDAQGKIAALAGGVLTGLLTVIFQGAILSEDRKRLVRYIAKDMLPFARKQAEAILEEGMKIQ